MNDPLIARFTAACGATAPLDLRVGLAEGGVLAEGSVGQPFTLIGRDDACEVTLSDPDVHLRHAWLQVLDGRVFALDISSRGGLVWPSGDVGSGWLDPGIPVRIGPFRVTLRRSVAARPVPPSPGLSPLHTDPAVSLSRTVVQLDFRNGKRAKDRWTVNRVVTLIGRADGCKIHLNADDISAYHCGLVHTPDGLWVVDLSGRGVVVNGERMRVAPLPHGAELWVGRFLIGCHYPAFGDTPAARPGVGTIPTRPGLPPPELPPPTTVTPVTPVAAEDEVPLGRMPAADPAAGLPSSHIMCDAFRLPAPSGPISAPIMVSNSGPTPPHIPVHPPVRPAHHDAGRVPPGRAGRHAPAHREPEAPPPAAGENFVGAIVRHLGDIHGQMFEQMQRSLLTMVHLCGQLREGQAAPVRKELDRIKELNGELADLHAEVTRMVLARAADDSHAAAPPELADLTFFPADQTQLSGPVVPHPGATPDAIREWVGERIGRLQQERQARWDKLVGLFAGGGNGVR